MEMKDFWRWLRGWRTARPEHPCEVTRARQLIAAIDAGGIPLDPRRIVRIAEDLGLEVSRKESIGRTIERIRTAIDRCTTESPRLS